MVIMGPKIVPEEEPKSESKSQIFSIRWMKEVTQTFNSSNKNDEDGVGTSEKKKKKYGWSMVRIRGTKQSSDQEQIRYENGCFDYKEIIAATENFSPANMIGRGGFGPVYKGVLPNKTAIAVKNLSSSSQQGKREFLNEINTISRLRHPNLVTLYGHCAVDNKFLLVYEYMENSCLATALSARLDLEKDTQINTRIVGTVGYMAPEYAMRGTLTAKADIYSFGVVILELISGKRCSDRPRDGNPHLLDFALALQMKGDLISLIEDNLKTGISVKEAYMVLDLAMLCISYSPDMRPSILKVVNILEGKTTIETPIRLKSDNLTSVYPDEMTMIDSPDNYIDNTTTELVTHQGNTSTSLESEALILSKYRSLISHAKGSTSEEQQDRVGVISSSHNSLKQKSNIYTTMFCGDSIAVAKDQNGVGGENTANSDLHSHVKDSISEGGNRSRLLIYTNVSTPETCLSNAKASTSSTFEDVTKVKNKAKLEYIEPYFEEGKCYIECSDEELKVGCNKWENSLVGCFLSESGAFDFDKEVDEDVLGHVSGVSSTGKGYTVSSVGRGHFLFQFSCDDDMTRVLESSGLLHIDGKTMILRKWDWKMKFDKVEMLKSIPVWVKIYNLPLFLWDSSFLSKVGSALGNPICADQKTLNQQRLDYARVYIQVIASKPLLDTLLISVKGNEYLLNFEYDWKPLRCSHCFTFGHLESKCTLKMKGKQVLK
ncbi:hypothetical protein MKW98_007437 [Papaver atlanticum]|uniref:Protein kinase domain-containing protein n=1 Tax=Papaver atlanticum TaxID=357466 RepID=A0AAD4XCJ1_9MAGN|nr:hypothetical protein MKW98_007437 [Papaver atlanticum]